MAGRGLKTAGAVVATYTIGGWIVGSAVTARTRAGADPEPLATVLLVLTLGITIYVGRRVWIKNSPDVRQSAVIRAGLYRINQRRKECLQHAIPKYRDGSPTHAAGHIAILHDIGRRAILRSDFDTALACDFFMQMFDGMIADLPENDLFGSEAMTDGLGSKLFAIGVKSRQRLLSQGLAADEAEFSRSARAALKHVVDDIEV
jgi:hypothetical protein